MATSSRGLGRLIGDRKFYGSVLSLAVPLVVQQTIASVVNLLDNVMVGRLSTEAISSVAIVSQILFVYNLMLFGSMSGASVYGAQFVGSRDDEGVRYAFRYKLICGIIIFALALTVMLLFGDRLVLLYISDADGGATSTALTELFAQDYMRISLWGLAPFMLSQCIGSTLRENGQARAPMIASSIAIGVNLVGNWLLIYGKLGFPALGVSGAAIATVISRYVEIAIMGAYCISARDEYPFLRGLVRTLKIPLSLAKRIFLTGWPLLVNETLWSLSIAAISQCYSVRGLQTMAAVNIESTIWQLFAVGMFSMGTAISVIVGQRLGANDIEGAKDADLKLLFLTFLVNVALGLALAGTSWLIPQAYNVEPEVRRLATELLIAAGLLLPINSVAQGIYFTIRSGGHTVITMFYDSIFCWVVQYPIAFLLSRFTDLSVVWIYVVIRSVMLVKVIGVGPYLLRGSWAQRIER